MRPIFVLIFCLMLQCGSYAQSNTLKEKQMNTTRNELAIRLKDYIQKEMSHRKIVGLSVAIVDSNGILLSDGFGKADKENDILADDSTLFPIASITKTFTGIAIMQLVEQGLIDLDKPIGTYIEELSLPNNEENIITTRMLLTHHSGIQGDIFYNWYLPNVSKDPLIYEQVVNLINEAGTIFTPGKLHSYCNAGYSLLGVLIHKVSGTPYVEYIRSNILSPLKMTNSIVFAGENSNAFISKGYDKRKVTEMPMKLGIPAGGIALSANDAAKYMMAIINSYHSNSALLNAVTMKKMMTQQNSNVILDKGFSIGFTWFLQDPIGEYTKYAAHRGELPPYHAMMTILPELKMGVLISVNNNKAATAPDEMTHKIIADLYEYYTGKALPIKEPEKIIPLNMEQIKEYEGTYPNVYFGPMTVKLKGKKLFLKSSVIPIPLSLIPLADSTFAVKAKLFGFIPLPIKLLKALKVEFRENEGDKYLYFIIQNSMLNPNIKVESFDLPQDYISYSGKYKVINMENSDRVVKNIKVDIKNSREYGILKYTFLGRHKFNLVISPIDKQNARIAGIGSFLGDKIHWETSDGKVLMYWSGLILEKQ
jgi:CubicO group peptidase (beta-lactamase class C family)